MKRVDSEITEVKLWSKAKAMKICSRVVMSFIAVAAAGTRWAQNPQSLKGISAKGFKMSISAN
ncbi:MAG: hypothetical protein WCO56_06335 [Verrucomicrobiota bacterium]